MTSTGLRRLAAILIADVVGYSRLMSRDEAGTLHALTIRNNTILAPLLAEHRGRLVKSMGDGVLVEFVSAVDAVECAMAYQSATRRANGKVAENQRILVRIGINLGDVMVEDGDLFGEGVNVAARLEALAEPGSVVVSQIVVSQVRGRVKFRFDDLGAKDLKHIAEPVRVYRVSAPASSSDAVPRNDNQSSKPSLAILPFANLNGSAEQDYFSDGITEDIITDLSQVSALSVVSSRMAFTFKGRQTELSQAAHKLNVRYLLEGSVRRAGSRVRITAQLVDSVTGNHLWAERYDRKLGDVFALQDDITRCVVAALRVKLRPAESTLVADRSTSNAEAYELYLKGRAKFFQSWGNVAVLKSARELFTKAVEATRDMREPIRGLPIAIPFCGSTAISTFPSTSCSPSATRPSAWRPAWPRPMPAGEWRSMSPAVPRRRLRRSNGQLRWIRYCSGRIWSTPSTAGTGAISGRRRRFSSARRSSDRMILLPLHCSRTSMNCRVSSNSAGRPRAEPSSASNQLSSATRMRRKSWGSGRRLWSICPKTRARWNGPSARSRWSPAITPFATMLPAPMRSPAAQMRRWSNSDT